jgi:hypothetical protein
MALVRSLRARVVLWVSVALVVLFAVTIVGLDIAFRDSTDRARLELLEVQVLGLIALAEPAADGGLTLPVDAIDPQFEVANSGLYGALYDSSGRAVWQSLSLLGRDFPVDELVAPGEQRHTTLDVPGFPPLEALLMGITWEFADGLGRLHVRDRRLARALHRAAKRVPPQPCRLVPRHHAHDAARDHWIAHVRAVAAAQARAPSA